jgi:6-phosphogluconolactonase
MEFLSFGLGCSVTHHEWMRRAAVGLLLISLGACGSSDPSPSPSPSPTPPPAAGRFVYVANQSSHDLSAFAVAGDGTVRLLGGASLSGVGVPSGMTADPQGRFLFVPLAGGQGGIQAYAVDRTSGLLSDVPGSPFDIGRQVTGMVLDAGGRFLWATRQDGDGLDVLTVDAATGALAPVDGASVVTSGAPHAPVLRADGRFLYIATFGPAAVATYAVDAATGHLTSIGTGVEAPDTVSGLAMDPSGTFLYLTTATPFTSDTVFLYSSSSTTGGLTPVPGSAFAPGFDFATSNLRPAGILFHPSSRFAYVPDRPGRTGAFSHGFWAFTFQGSGLLGPSAVGPYSTASTAPFLIGDPSGFALDPAGRFAYMTDATSSSVSAFSIDLGTGALTALGPPVATGQSPIAIVVVP